MKDFGKTRSTVKPDAVVIDDNSVWVHTDIQEVHESVGEDQSFDGYEFNMIQYEKDEHIKLMADKSAQLESDTAQNRSDIDYLMLVTDNTDALPEEV